MSPIVPDSSPPICPTCQGGLAKRPKAKTRCPHCGAFIYVRSPSEGGCLLVKEADLPAVGARWAQHHVSPGPRADWSYVGVVGESHRNADGSHRQVIIRDRVQIGALARLVPEPENPHDRRAVKVCLETGEQIGYLDREQARELGQQRRQGWRHEAVIHRVTGGTADKPSRGVVLRLVSGPPGVTDTELAAAVARARTTPDRWEDELTRKAEPGPRVQISLEVASRGDRTVAAPPVTATRRLLMVLGLLVAAGLLLYAIMIR